MYISMFIVLFKVQMVFLINVQVKHFDLREFYSTLKKTKKKNTICKTIVETYSSTDI